MVSKVQYIAEKREAVDRVFRMQEIIHETISAFSGYIRSDAYKSVGIISLIAFGTRGLKRLQVQTAQPSIRWFKNPALPIYAGLGILTHSTITKFLFSTEMDAHLMRSKVEFIRDQEKVAKLDRAYASRVVNKS